MAGTSERNLGMTGQDEETGAINPPSDDEDDLIVDSDDDVSPETAAKTAEKKAVEEPEWKVKLKEKSKAQENLPEDQLHLVQWSAVIMNFAQHVLTLGAFVGYVSVSGVSALLALPLFMVTFFLAIVLVEFMQTVHVRWSATTGFVLTGAFAGGCFHFGVFECVQLAAYWSFAPMLLTVGILCLAETPARLLDGGLLSVSPLWQAITGKRRVVVWEELELAALAKALHFNAEVGKLSAFQLKMANCLEKIGIRSSSPLVLGLVSVDVGNDFPDIPLSIDDEEILPEHYSVLRLRHVVDCDNLKAINEAPMQEFIQMVRRRRSLTDKVVRSWLKGAEAAERTPAAPGASAEGAVLHWATGMQLEPKGNDCVLVTLERLDYKQGLMDHWAVRSAWNAFCCVLLGLPTLHMFMQMDEQRREVCDINGRNEGHLQGPQFLGGQLICSGDILDGPESCKHVCASLITFIGAVHDCWHTSYVELGLVGVMLPIYIFTQSVAQVRKIHTDQVLQYLRTMRQPMNAIHEVMQVKKTFEDIFDLNFLVSRFRHSLQAWLASDASLGACGMITEEEFNLTATKGVNDCLRQVMEPVRSMKSALSCEKTDGLAFGIGALVGELPTGDDLQDIFEDEETCECAEEVRNAWDMLKFRNNLGGDSDRNYKVLIDLQICNEAAWKLFKNWLRAEYHQQLEFITSKDQYGESSQDNGKSAHLTKNTAIHDILLPKGFSLSHIFVTAMPEDGTPYQILVEGSRKGSERFWDNCKQLVDAIKKAVVEDEDDRPEETSILDYRLSKSPINARFALSEQYYENMEMSEIQALCPELGNPTKKPPFTTFVDACLRPDRFVQADEFQAKDGKKLEEVDAEEALYWAAISVFMGDENPLNALVGATKRCLTAFSVYITCMFLALFIPVLRSLSGGQLFPAPYRFWIVLSTISIWYQLTMFFSYFHMSQTRLSLINECLQILLSNTNKPAAPAGAGPVRTKKRKKEPAPEAKKEGDAPATVSSGGVLGSLFGSGGGTPAAAEGQAAASSGSAAAAEGQAAVPAQPSQAELAAKEEARNKKKQEEDTRPFDLVLAETSREYVPGDDFWAAEWKKKHDNVKNWHMTVSYLRVFVSTSRLTAQTMLAAGVIVLGFLCLVSFMQAASGHAPGAVAALAHSHTRLLLHSAAEGGAVGAGELHGEVARALGALAEEHRAPARALSPEDTTHSARGTSAMAARLRERLAPAHEALAAPLVRQGQALAEGQGRLREWTASSGMAGAVAASYRRLREAGDEVHKAQAQASTMMAAMDVTKATKTQLFTVTMLLFIMLYSVPLMWNVVVVNSHFDFHEDLLIKQQEQHRQHQSKREWKMADPTAAIPDDPDLMKGLTPDVEKLDPDCARYERVLKVAIKSSHKTRERFPLKLFGFVITFHLLATWIGMAAAPLVSQAAALAPPMSLVACRYLEHSRLAASLQRQMDASHPELKMNVSKMIDDNLCNPLKDFLGSAVAHNVALHQQLGHAMASHAGQQANNFVTGRRLLTAATSSQAAGQALDELRGPAFEEVYLPDLAGEVRAWWREHPTVHAEAKYVTAATLLHELDHEGDRLLVRSPSAVLRAFGDAEPEDAQASYAAASALALHELRAALGSRPGRGRPERPGRLERSEL